MKKSEAEYEAHLAALEAALSTATIERDEARNQAGRSSACYQQVLKSYYIDQKTYEEVVGQKRSLTAELARVKAESLRVVPDDNGHWWMTPEGIGWSSEDNHGERCVETPTGYYSFINCDRIRLERWEASE